MANLTRLHRWERLVPDLGDNRELERPFFLEVAAGLSRERREAAGIAVREAYDASVGEGGKLDFAALAKHAAAALADIVRLGAEPLTVDGQPITSLEEYLLLVLAAPGAPNYVEIVQSVSEFNSAEGNLALFFARRSGGASTTPDQSAAKAAAPMAGQPGGRTTSAPASSGGPSPSKEAPRSPT